MPPTPVAAPSKGSTAEGWLWLSIFSATARPSPTSTTPAFSPGPCSTRGPAVGKARRRGRLCLYEQCSLHIRLNMTSSASLGSRPSSSGMRAASSSVSPSRRWRGVAVVTLPR